MAKRHYIPVTADVPGVDEKKCALIRKAIRNEAVVQGPPPHIGQRGHLDASPLQVLKR